MNYIYQFGQYEEPQSEFDEIGVHSETGTIFDPEGFDKDGFNEFDFNRENIHRVTGTKYSPQGFDCFGKTENLIDIHGFNLEGVHTITGTKFDPQGYDINGFDNEGISRDGYDCNGFDFFTGIHRKYPIRPEDINDYLHWVHL